MGDFILADGGRGRGRGRSRGRGFSGHSGSSENPLDRGGRRDDDIFGQGRGRGANIPTESWCFNARSQGVQNKECNDGDAPTEAPPSQDVRAVDGGLVRKRSAADSVSNYADAIDPKTVAGAIVLAGKGPAVADIVQQFDVNNSSSDLLSTPQKTANKKKLRGIDGVAVDERAMETTEDDTSAAP